MGRMEWFAIGIGVVLGGVIAVIDQRSQNDDQAMVTLILLIGSGGIVGFLLPVRTWRGALAIAMWLPLSHIIARALGVQDPFHPDTPAARLLLLPVALVATLVGAYPAAVLRRLVLPPGSK